VSGVTYQAPGTNETLLQDVSFSVPAGTMALIYGRSGSGKTTLLNTLAGLVEPTSGSIEVLHHRCLG